MGIDAITISAITISGNNHIEAITIEAGLSMGIDAITIPAITMLGHNYIGHNYIGHN